MSESIVFPAGFFREGEPVRIRGSVRLAVPFTREIMDAEVRRIQQRSALDSSKRPPDTRTESDLLVRRAFARAVGGRP